MTRDTLRIPKTDFDITTVQTLDEVEGIRDEWEQMQLKLTIPEERFTVYLIHLVPRLWKLFWNEYMKR